MEGIGFALAKIFSERSARHAGRPAGDLETVRGELMNRGGLSLEEAEALLWGESVRLDLEKTKNLAEAFSLDVHLLGCLLRPTSREIVLHVLRSFRSEMDPSCEDCVFLQSALEEAPRMNRSDLHQTCIDFLEHFSSMREEVSFSPALGNLIDVFSDLDSGAQARVLAYAYNEAAQSVGDPLQAQTEKLAAFRQEIPLLHRQILDLLAKDGQEISVKHIAEKLELRDARSVGQLPRSLEKMLRGRSLETPLRVRRVGGQSFYRLSEETLSLWQSLLRAEASLG